METNEFIERVKVIKKGDILVVKYKDINFGDNGNIPRHSLVTQQHDNLGQIKNFFMKYNKKTGLNIGILFIPDSIDIEAIRLEEWFV